MEWMLERLKESSTWKGIAVLAGIAGYSVSPEMWQSIAGIVAAVIGLIEIARKEKNNESKEITDAKTVSDADSSAGN